jgi:hypothetical protein
VKTTYCKYLIFFTVWGACQNKTELPVNEYNNLIYNPTTASGILDSARIPILEVKERVLDFGMAHQGDTIRQEFVLYNRGKASLLISNVSSSCGCAKPEISKNQVESGDSTSLNIIFTTQDQIGTQEKTFTIYSNTNPAITKVQLIGNVLK